MGFYAGSIFRLGNFSVLSVSLGLLLFRLSPPFNHPALEIRSTPPRPPPPDPEASESIFKTTNVKTTITK